MAVLELEYLHEIGRTTEPADVVVAALGNRLGLQVPQSRLDLIAQRALTVKWTRDPFDRLIAGQAIADQLPLLTADRRMREHLALAVWE